VKQYVPTKNETYFSGMLQKDIYADWEQSGGDLGQGPVGHAKGNRLPFEPAHQKPGVVPFKTKGR
jgi:hypothetical protein